MKTIVQKIILYICLGFMPLASIAGIIYFFHGEYLQDRQHLLNQIQSIRAEQNMQTQIISDLKSHVSQFSKQDAWKAVLALWQYHWETRMQYSRQTQDLETLQKARSMLNHIHDTEELKASLDTCIETLKKAPDVSYILEHIQQLSDQIMRTERWTPPTQNTHPKPSADWSMASWKIWITQWLDRMLVVQRIATAPLPSPNGFMLEKIRAQQVLLQASWACMRGDVKLYQQNIEMAIQIVAKWPNPIWVDELKALKIRMNPLPSDTQ